jgi:hypothetical protein
MTEDPGFISTIGEGLGKPVERVSEKLYKEKFPSYVTTPSEPLHVKKDIDLFLEPSKLVEEEDSVVSQKLEEIKPQLVDTLQVVQVKSESEIFNEDFDEVNKIAESVRINHLCLYLHIVILFPTESTF